MKKLLLILVMFLLGSVPLEEWEKGTPEQQTGFLQILAEAFAPTIKCIQGEIHAVGMEGKVYFLFDCEKFKEEKRL